MFYTKYRPLQFSELLNLDHVVSTLTKALEKGNQPHAYFFAGSRGTGKTTTARLLGKALNCENPVFGPNLKVSKEHVFYEPCGKCPSCLAVQTGSHLDIIEIDAASNRGIDNIRDLRDKVKLSPVSGKNKVYIIDEVHMLTTDASNALLKTLEEPPAHAYFILCTTNPEKVLDTVKSRCLSFKFAKPSKDNIVAKLRKIAESEKADISDEKLKRVALLSKGAFRDAETILEQIVNGESFIEDLLNSKELDFYEFFKLLCDGNVSEAIGFVQRVNISGVNLENWTEKFIEYLRSLMLFKVGVRDLGDMESPDEKEVELISKTPLSMLKDLVEAFTKALDEFKTAFIPTLPLEMAILSIEDRPQNGVVGKNPSTDGNNGKPNDKINTTGNKIVTEKNANDKKEDVKEEKEEKANPDKEEPKTTVLKDKPFPYAQLIEKVKPYNHSIHVMLRACDVQTFDGETLKLVAYYSFHKERIMSRKIRDMIENYAAELNNGSKVLIECTMSDKKPNARDLTDLNISTPNKNAASEDVVEALEKIFGDDLEAV